MSGEVRVAIALLLVVTAAKLALAYTWDPLADEAYYWAWSREPALGYFDQPPLIAWVLAVFGGHSPLALRWFPVMVGAVAPFALWRYAGDRALWLLWWTALPPLGWLTLFATPDALLLGAWVAALAGALRGGRGWVVAGVAIGVGMLAKYSALALLPGLLLAADPAERRTAWPWVGALAALVIVAPNLAWNAAHGWVTFGFQLGEGLLHDRPPGAWGPLLVVLQQLLVATPIAALAGVAWACHRPTSRTERMAWATSAPLLVFFALAALGGPPDAHWPAPAWIGLGLGLSHGSERLQRAAYLGASLALFASAAIAAHGVWRLWPLPTDPADRLREGRLLAEQVSAWTLPEGAAAGERPEALPLVLTERYQEAALLAWHLGADARTAPGCGRPNQFDLDDRPLPDQAWFVRPARGGPLRCTSPEWVADAPRELVGVDERGRQIGRWQLFRLTRATP